MKRGCAIALVALIGLLSAQPAVAQNTPQVNTELPTAAALSDAVSNPTAPGVGGFAMVWDGSTQWKRLAVGTAGSAATTVLTIQGIASGTPVRVDVAQVLGSTLSATNPLPVRLANASGYISEDTQSVFGGAVTFTAGAAPTGGFGTWCRVSASAPSTTGVADDDAVLPWCKNTGELQVGVITVPTDPFGANADAASATGSISAKLRFIAATGIPVTSLPTVVLQAETTKVIGTVRALGNGGAAFDQATGSAVPANALYMGVNGPSGNLRGWTAVNPSGAIYAGQVDLASFLGSTVSASNPIWVATVPTATGGWSALNATAADGATACTNSAQSVKGSQGTFGGYYINNPNTSDVWLHVYNVASGSVTVGTTTPALSFRISGVSANSVGANLELANGVQFSTAISIACTSTAGGNGAPSNAVEADIFYK